MDNDIQNLFLKLKVENKDNREVLYINDMELKGVEKYKIIKRSDNPCGMTELELKMIVLFI